MTTLLVWLLALLVVGAAGFGVIVLLTDRALPMAEMPPDRRPSGLPRDRPLHPADIHALRFDLALRGYRMAQVDDVLARLTEDLADREAELTELRERLAGRQDGAADQRAEHQLTPADGEQRADG